MTDKKRIVGIAVVALALSSCAGTVVRPLFGMRDVRIPPKDAAGLTRIVLIPVEVRSAMLPGQARWEDEALLTDKLLHELVRDAARGVSFSGNYDVRMSDRGIVDPAEPASEPSVMLLKWLKRDVESAEADPSLSDVDAIVEIAWAPFAPPIKHVEVAARVVDARSGRVIARAMRLILDVGFPPKIEQGKLGIASALQGVGLYIRD